MNFKLKGYYHVSQDRMYAVRASYIVVFNCVDRNKSYTRKWCPPKSGNDVMANKHLADFSYLWAS